MKKRNLFIIALTFAIFMPFSFLSAATLAERLSGKILLQVEDAGQAWYVEPGTGKRAFLGRPDDAFRIMRELGLGISDVDLNTIGIHEQYQERVQEQTKTQGQAGKNEVENKEETTNEETGTTTGEAEDVSGATDIIQIDQATSTEDQATSTPVTETGQTSLGKACEFTATYYRNTDLSSKLLIRTEEGIDHDWGAGNPDGVYLSDKFSVRWTGNCEFAEGRYRFTGTFDDAVKATIDNTWIYNYWVSNSDGVSFETELDITGGTHYIKVDYYEYFGNAVAKLDWEKIE